MNLRVLAAFAVASLAWTPPSVAAQTLGAEFAADYSLLDLGSVPALPPPYGGVFILASEPGRLCIGGDANDSTGALYTIDLVRDGDGLITGFSGTATRVADAPFIDT